MTVREMPGDGFSHLVLERRASPASNVLHVYIEGDGIPWAGNLPAADPTPVDKLTLRLAVLDDKDVVYLGRPCYFDRAASNGCHPRYWTSHRYGEEVLDSMAAAIARIRLPRHRSVVLFGHSGGGTLAVLLGSRLDDVAGVVSIAANLDVDAWTNHHGYDRLDGSLNPIHQPRNPSVPHLQLVGIRDRTVPVATSRQYAKGRANVDLIEYEGFDHACCWERDWPDILGFVERHLHTSAHFGAKTKITYRYPR